MDDFIVADIRKTLYNCFKRYGIGGTEDKIKEIYQNMPTLRGRFLMEYWNIIKRNNLKENN